MTFTILKDFHKSRFFPRFIFKNEISGNVVFKGDFKYTIEHEHQKDTNKLIGFSDNWNHHKDSVRIGWRNNGIDDIIEIMGIFYINGEREIVKICEAKPNKKYEFSIRVYESFYKIDFNGMTWIQSRPIKSRMTFIRYMLFPYFGGVIKSPKKFTFELNY